jgi:Pvc16 N-terminal domain
MIEDVDSRLAAWAERIAGPGARVSLRAPADGNEGSGVSVFLMELAAQPPLRGEQRTPLQLALRYLVTAWAGEPSAEHALLGGLVMAAMEEEDLDAPLSHASPTVRTARTPTTVGESVGVWVDGAP